MDLTKIILQVKSKLGWVDIFKLLSSRLYYKDEFKVQIQYTLVTLWVYNKIQIILQVKSKAKTSKVTRGLDSVNSFQRIIYLTVYRCKLTLQSRSYLNFVELIETIIITYIAYSKLFLTSCSDTKG